MKIKGFWLHDFSWDMHTFHSGFSFVLTDPLIYLQTDCKYGWNTYDSERCLDMYLNYKDLYLSTLLQQMTDSLKGNKVFPKCPQPPSRRPCIELGDLVSQWAPASQFVADEAWFCYFFLDGYSGSLIGPPVWFQVPAVMFSLRKDIKQGAFIGGRILPRLMDL